MGTTLYDTAAPTRHKALMLNSDPVAMASEAGLDPSVIAEEALEAALARKARADWDARIAEACAAHDAYLAEYGSLADYLRAMPEADAAESPALA